MLYVGNPTDAKPVRGYRCAISGIEHSNKAGASVTERQSALPPNTATEERQTMTLQGLNDAKHWRDRAAEMRVLSAGMRDPKAQLLMSDLANDYDTLADRAEGRVSSDMPVPSPRAKDW
jgi:hypothetical protein